MHWAIENRTTKIRNWQTTIKYLTKKFQWSSSLDQAIVFNSRNQARWCKQRLTDRKCKIVPVQVDWIV